MGPHANERRSDAMTGEGALRHLTERARAVVHSRALQWREKTNVKIAQALLTKEPEDVSRRQRAYRNFLLDLRERTNESALFICMATLGQKRAIEMTELERRDLLKRLETAVQREPFNSKGLREKAKVHLEGQARISARCKCLV